MSRCEVEVFTKILTLLGDFLILEIDDVIEILQRDEWDAWEDGAVVCPWPVQGHAIFIGSTRK
jgi:hypothetical protein